MRNTETYERDAALPETVTVDRFGGVAFRVRGWQLVPDEDTEWSGIWQRTDQVVCVMVGDDRPWLFELDELTPLDDAAYCHVCGQIGCTHDGRPRNDA